MRHVLSGVLSGVVVAATGASVSASAAAAPTIGGPSTAKYYSIVSLTGTTPTAGQRVVVYVRAAGTSARYAPRRDLHSDASGRFSVKLRISRAYSYFARSGGVNSAAHTTRVLTARCRTGGRAFALPFTPSYRGLRSPHNPYFDFAQLTVTRGGTWAGVAYRYEGNVIHLVQWRAGQRAVSLASYHYRGAYDPQRSVVPVGFTPGGAVVAAVQDPAVVGNSFAGGRFLGLYWLHGRKHYLEHRSSWWGWTPTSVTDSGRIVGYASTGSHRRPTYYAVSWASANSRPTVVAPLGKDTANVLATGEGDVVWTRPDGYSFAKLRDGSVHQLRNGTPDSADYVSRYLYPHAAGRTAVYANGPHGLLRWDFAHPPAGGVFPSAVAAQFGGWSYPTAVGARGDIIVDTVDPAHLLTAAGALATLPAQLYRENGSSFRAIDAHGTVSFTSPKDRLVHLVRCR